MTPSPTQVQTWLRQQHGFEDASVTEVLLADGGASNITCRIALHGVAAPFVGLRVQRDHGIFEPYDVLREACVLRALASTAIPAPALLATEPSPTVFGGPALLMEWIDAPHMGVAGPEADFGAFTRAVVAIHASDWAAAGLDFLGVPSSAAAGIASELEIIAARMVRFGCAGEPLLARALTRLQETIPSDGRIALCQGDINVYNYLFRNREVVGVVDWEQARLSDPRCDIGQLMALSHLKGAPWGPAGETNFVRAYQAAGGAPLHGMEFFRARWLFELGVIYFGWKAFNDSDPWYAWADLVELLESALAELG